MHFKMAILYIHTVFGAPPCLANNSLTCRRRRLGNCASSGASTQMTWRCSACMEIERMRQVFLEIESYRIVVERCWRQETRGQLVALVKLRMLIAGERSRLGISSDDVPPAPDYAGKRYP